MRTIEEILKSLRDQIDDLESEVQDLWDDYIKVSEERDELEEKLRELES